MRLGRSRHHPESAHTEAGPEADISVLGPELCVAGELQSTGEVQVYGSIHGNLHAPKVIIRPGGQVEGDIVADEASIGGRLNGRIMAPVVAVEETGAVTGRIFHHQVTVAKGAFVDGRMPWRPLNHFNKSASIVEEPASEHVHEKRSGS
jgi:cytoskeletal protein CcmA (bactofilin family)